jgi:hypothetical protein
MEILLNLLWLITAVAVFSLWMLRWIPAREARSNRMFTEAVALVAVFALLFPVISLTDDLHPEIAVVDAASGKRSACYLCARTSHAQRVTEKWANHSPVAVPTQTLTQVVLTAANMIAPLAAVHPIEYSAEHHGRSPPFPLL